MASFIPNILISKFQDMRQYFTPVLEVSQFYEKGQLTPDEFVLAGEYLTRLAPSWSWARGDDSRLKPYLPPDKQFLISKRVVCMKRVHQMVNGDADIISMKASETVLPQSPESSVRSAPSPEDDDTYDDLSSYIESDLVTASIPAIPFPPSTDSEHIRYYDISIVYDNYYRTPRVYLCGFTPEGRPLGQGETMEDIIQDYIQKTATIDAHPHTGLQNISIHPCRHAETIKRIVDLMSSNDKTPPIQMYLFIFLKFISSMIPTIDYDNTMPVTV